MQTFGRGDHVIRVREDVGRHLEAEWGVLGRILISHCMLDGRCCIRPRGGLGNRQDEGVACLQAVAIGDGASIRGKAIYIKVF